MKLRRWLPPLVLVLMIVLLGKCCPLIPTSLNSSSSVTPRATPSAVSLATAELAVTAISSPVVTPIASEDITIVGPTITDIATPTVLKMTVKSDANLRSGPGTNYEIVGSRKAGDVVEVEGKSSDGTWYELVRGFWIFGELVDGQGMAVPAVTVAPTIPPPTSEPVQYVNLLGHLFVDVKVYYGLGAQKAYGFKVVGGSNRCGPRMPSGKGVMVEYPNGTLEWKDRDYLVQSGLYFVRSDDPNRSSFMWTDNLPGCP